MTGRDQLIEQSILEYESRLKHVDELLDRAHHHQPPAEVAKELEQARHERQKMAAHLQEMRRKPPEHWREEEIEMAGPMGIWDAVAQQLEKLVEKLER